MLSRAYWRSLGLVDGCREEPRFGLVAALWLRLHTETAAPGDSDSQDHVVDVEFPRFCGVLSTCDASVAGRMDWNAEIEAAVPGPVPA